MAIHMQTHSIPSTLYLGRKSFVKDNIPSHVSEIFDNRKLFLQDLKEKCLAGKKILLITDGFLNYLFLALKNEYKSLYKNVSAIILDNGTMFYYNYFKTVQSTISLDSLFQSFLDKIFYLFHEEFYSCFEDLVLLCLLSKNMIGPRTPDNFPLHSLTAYISHPEAVYQHRNKDSLSKEDFLKCIQKLDNFQYWNTLNQSQKDSVKRMFLFDQKAFDFFEYSDRPIVLFLVPYCHHSSLSLSQYESMITILYEKFGDSIYYVTKYHPKDVAKKCILVNYQIPNNILPEIFLLLYSDKISAVVGHETSALLNMPPSIPIFDFYEPSDWFIKLGINFAFSSNSFI